MKTLLLTKSINSNSLLIKSNRVNKLQKVMTAWFISDADTMFLWPIWSPTAINTSSTVALSSGNT